MRAIPGPCAPAVPREQQTPAAIHRGFPPHTGRMRSVHSHPPSGFFTWEIPALGRPDKGTVGFSLY